jgi:preprotein translocase subunit SecY
MANPIQNLFRFPELKDRIVFTLLILLIYRVGSHITAPGVNLPALEAQFGALSGTLFGVYDAFVGGGLSKATIFALGIMPYISASIMFQLLAAVFPAIEKLQKEGEDGRKRLTQWTRYTTLLLCVLQSYGYSVFVASTPGAVTTGGVAFTFSTIITLSVGGMFIMWLGEQLTEHGIGNGMSLLIFFGIVQGLPNAIARTWEALMVGEIQIFALVALLAVVLGVTAGVVSMTMGARQIPVQIPRKVVGRGRVQEGQKSYVPIRLNASGVMPVIFAQSFMILPVTIASVSSWALLRELSDIFQPGNWLYYVVYGVLIVFFSYFYTAIIFNPVDLAENLKKQGNYPECAWSNTDAGR